MPPPQEGQSSQLAADKAALQDALAAADATTARLESQLASLEAQNAELLNAQVRCLLVISVEVLCIIVMQDREGI